MRYQFQPGGVDPRDDLELSIDAEVAYNGLWWSVNDHFRYRLMTEGFGQHDQTFRRRTVTSAYYAGEYQVGSVKDNTRRTWMVKVGGATFSELEENVDFLVNAFTQDSYNVRLKRNEVVETWLCDQADYSIDQSHVFLHNAITVVKLTFGVHPTVSKEIVL